MDETSVGDIEDQICSLAGRINSATAQLITLVGEFDAREGWAGYGLKSCAHWLSWRCQIGTHAAREQVRVARALRTLPLASCAFQAGRLSYAKVRALTRIATPDNENDLLELAESATAAQVERTVACWRRVETLTDVERAERRHLSWHFDDHGMLHLRGCLDTEEAGVLLAALEAVAGTLETTGSQDPDDPAAEQEPSRTPAHDLSAVIGHGPPAVATDDRSTVPRDDVSPPTQYETVAAGGQKTSPRGRVEAIAGLARAFLNGDVDPQREPDTQ
jgi:hypothetical protein